MPVHRVPHTQIRLLAVPLANVNPVMYSIMRGSALSPRALRENIPLFQTTVHVGIQQQSKLPVGDIIVPRTTIANILIVKILAGLQGVG